MLGNPPPPPYGSHTTPRYRNNWIMPFFVFTAKDPPKACITRKGVPPGTAVVRRFRKKMRYAAFGGLGSITSKRVPFAGSKMYFIDFTTKNTENTACYYCLPRFAFCLSSMCLFFGGGNMYLYLYTVDFNTKRTAYFYYSYCCIYYTPFLSSFFFRSRRPSKRRGLFNRVTS